MTRLVIWFFALLLMASAALAQDRRPVSTPEAVPETQLELAVMPPDAPDLLFEERAAIAAVCKEGVWVERWSLYTLYGIRIITLQSVVTCVGNENYFLVRLHCNFLSVGRCQLESTKDLGFQFEVEKRLYASKMRPQTK